MTVTLTMPRLGESMEEGTVAAWLVEEGAAFARGDALVEFETDKTAVEFPALGPGRLSRALVAPGAVVKLGQPIAEIELDGAEDWVSGVGAAPAEDGVGAAPDAGEEKKVVVDLPMPRLGETMEEGIVASWVVAEGDLFARGEPILEIETDKTVAAFPALFPGRLLEILARRGEAVAVGRPIARVEVDAADAPDEAVRQPAASAEAADEAASVPARASLQRGACGPRATPPARRAARRRGIAIEQIAGTGRRGRIELRDVEAAAPTGESVRNPAPLAESRWGPDDGTGVLLVHGFAGDRLTVDRLGQALGRAGFAARAVDLPGHGETRTEARRFADLVEALAADIAGSPPTHVVAHSLGAAVAVEALSRGGAVRSLTLIAPAGLGLSIDGTFVSAMAGPASKGQTGHLLRRLSPRAADFSDAMTARVHEALARGRLVALARDVAEGDRQKIDVTRSLAALAGQVVVRAIVGHRDTILDWRDVLSVSPRIAVHHVPDAGHMPHWDAPDAVRDILIGELDHV